MELEGGKLLQNGRYKIVSMLGQGGFGITYLAVQTGLERQVAIKEFFLKQYCTREGSTSHVSIATDGNRELVSKYREKFLKEARNIARLDHPNIVRIIDIFEENDTAYYVMEYLGNTSLADKVKQEGPIPEPLATNYIRQVASALSCIHDKKMNHLDVKPANIMITTKGEAVLIDFGLSKQYDASGEQTSTTPVGFSDGYAPLEQYCKGGVRDFSPETDIYALAATFYKLLTGITPPSSADVNEDGLPIESLKDRRVSQNVIDAICKAMESRKKDRTHDIASFIENITSHVVVKDNPQEGDNGESTVIIHPEEVQEIKVRTLTASSITAHTAIVSGEVLDDGGISSAVRGIAYSTEKNPTRTGNSIVCNGYGNGIYECKLTTLQPGVTYHVRAYATTPDGTVYGEEKTFTTYKAVVETSRKNNQFRLVAICLCLITILIIVLAVIYGHNGNTQPKQEYHEEDSSQPRVEMMSLPSTSVNQSTTQTQTQAQTPSQPQTQTKPTTSQNSTNNATTSSSSPKPVTQPTKPVKAEETNETKLEKAINSGNYGTVKKLADDGYQPAKKKYGEYMYNQARKKYTAGSYKEAKDCAITAERYGYSSSLVNNLIRDINDYID